MRKEWKRQHSKQKYLIWKIWWKWKQCTNLRLAAFSILQQLFASFSVVISCTSFSKHHFHIVVMMHTLKAGCNFNFITFSDGRCCYFLHNTRLNVIMLEIFLLTLPAKHHMIKDSLWVSWIFEGYAYCFLLVTKCSLNCPGDLLYRRINPILFIDEIWSLHCSLRWWKLVFT